MWLSVKKKSLIGILLHSFIFCGFLTILILQQQSQAGATKAEGQAAPKAFIIYPFTEGLLTPDLKNFIKPIFLADQIIVY